MQLARSGRLQLETICACCRDISLMPLSCAVCDIQVPRKDTKLGETRKFESDDNIIGQRTGDDRDKYKTPPSQVYTGLGAGCWSDRAEKRLQPMANGVDYGRKPSFLGQVHHITRFDTARSEHEPHLYVLMHAHGES